MTVAIVTDGAAALPAEVQARLGVGVVPMTVSIDGIAVVESDLTLDELLTTPGLTTSGPSPGAFATAMAAADSPDGVLVLTVAASLSSTHQSAVLAANSGGAGIRVLDTGTAAGGQALVVEAAAEAAAAGRTLDEVAARADQVARRVRLVGALDGLDQLVRSGRIPALAGKAGDRLGVRPLFEIVDGEIRSLRPAHSIAAASARILKLWRATRPCAGSLHLVALHAGAPHRATALLDAVRSEAEPISSFVSGFGPAMIVNSGPGVFGLAWWWDVS